MSRFEKLPHQEIARRLNISANTVKTQIRRALEKLKKLLDGKLIEYKQEAKDKPQQKQNAALITFFIF